MHIAPKIDYQKIADAQKYYSAAGFIELAVPWIIDYSAYSVTCPANRREFYALGGYMNASGEQSFIQMMLSGAKLGRNFCVTSCYRDEPVLDELHHRYFVKLELIDTDVSENNLAAMIRIAQKFFDGYLPQEFPAKVVKTNEVERSFDIVDGFSGIELGSYGIRRHKEFSWIYGTGIALPRLDTVLQKMEARHV